METFIAILIVLYLVYRFLLKPIFGAMNKRQSNSKSAAPSSGVGLKHKTFSKVAGVTFKNPDGSDRQKNISKYVKEGQELFLKGYEYKPGEVAFAVLAKDGDMSSQIGNLTAEMAEVFLHTDQDTEFEMVAKSITGGTDKKPTLGVNIEIRSDRRL